MPKKSASYPNEQFRSIDEYVDFARKHRVFGKDAYDLKKKLDKQTAIPEPKIYDSKR